MRIGSKNIISPPTKIGKPMSERQQEPYLREGSLVRLTGHPDSLGTVIGIQYWSHQPNLYQVMWSCIDPPVRAESLDASWYWIEDLQRVVR